MDFPPAHQGVKNKGPMDQTHEEWRYCSSVGCKPPPKQAQALPQSSAMLQTLGAISSDPSQQQGTALHQAEQAATTPGKYLGDFWS